MAEEIFISSEFEDYLKRPASPKFCINAAFAKIVEDGINESDADDSLEEEPLAPCFLLNSWKTYFNHVNRELMLLANRDDEGAIEFLNTMLASKDIAADIDEKIVAQTFAGQILAIKNKNEEIFRPYTAIVQTGSKSVTLPLSVRNSPVVAVTKLKKTLATPLAVKKIVKTFYKDKGIVTRTLEEVQSSVALSAKRISPPSLPPPKAKKKVTEPLQLPGSSRGSSSKAKPLEEKYCDVEGAKAIWTKPETSSMLSMCADFADEIGPCKRFRLKNDMFHFISQSLNAEFGGAKNQKQVSDKYKNLMKEKKKQIAQKQTSGAAGGHKIDFEEELDAIAAIDDSLEPDIMMGVHANQIVEKQSHHAPKRRERKPRIKRIETVERVEIFLKGLHELADKKEASRKERDRLKAEAKERRHTEKMAKIDEIFGYHALT